MIRIEGVMLYLAHDLLRAVHYNHAKIEYHHPEPDICRGSKDWEDVVTETLTSISRIVIRNCEDDISFHDQTCKESDDATDRPDDIIVTEKVVTIGQKVACSNIQKIKKVLRGGKNHVAEGYPFYKFILKTQER